MALRNLTNLPQGERPQEGKVGTPGHGKNAVTAMRDPERNAKDFTLIPSSSLPSLVGCTSCERRADEDPH